MYLSLCELTCTRKVASYSAYTGGRTFQLSLNSDKVLIWNALLRYERSVIYTSNVGRKLGVYNRRAIP